MEIPMHRFKYTKLTKQQVEQKLKATDAGPQCASEVSDILAGRSLKIVTDDGPTLSYTFRDKNKLTLAENGGAAVEASYGALPLKEIVFFSHMIPNTVRGFNVFVDLETNLATVFEVWFCGGEIQGTVLDDREVQRQIYFGYVDVAGQEAPTERHTTTNRLEGTGFYWKQDTGIETLDLFPSIISSNFVELTRHVDDLSYCSPSDYVMINDNLFIYDRTECEFSGIMTLYVLDLFTETQAGMRLGFNEKDELEYYIFNGTGKIVGQLTSLAPFDEHGENTSSIMGAKSKPGAAPATPPKGQRTVYRPGRTFTNMTEEEVHQAAEKSTRTFTGDANTPQEQGGGGMGGNALPFSDLLVGKQFTLHYDNGEGDWEYKFTDLYNLQWRKQGENQWQEETYRAFEADEKLVFFAHILTGSRPRACRRIALDLTNGLTTCILSKMGTKYYGNEVSYRAVFGAAEIEGVESPTYVRHEFTDELVGRGFTRTYSDQMTSMHLYTTPHSSSWTIFTGNQTLGMQWCAPALYVKLRDGVYIFDLVEEGCNGAETCIIENEKTKRACGFGYSGGARGVGLNTIGAIARDIGGYDVKHFFGPNERRKAKGV
ncbi:MAG: MoaF N-terminal domain-containing protein [Acidobacteriota bacterium]